MVTKMGIKAALEDHSQVVVKSGVTPTVVEDAQQTWVLPILVVMATNHHFNNMVQAEEDLVQANLQWEV